MISDIEVFYIGFLTFIIVICFVGYIYRLIVRENFRRKVSVIPVYKLPTFRLYEVGALIDGMVQDRDMVATVVNNILNPEKQRDELEQSLYNKYASPAALNSLLNKLIEDRKENNHGSNRLIWGYQRKVNRKLIKQGYYAYDPSTVRSIAMLIAFALLFIDYSFTGEAESISDWQIIPLSVAGAFALMAYVFHQNYQKVSEARNVLEGYRMFLSTTESQRLERDPSSYEDHLPMLIALGVHKNSWKDILNYTITKLRNSAASDT